MEKTSVYVGLDYHQSFVRVCVVDAAGRAVLNRPCDNDWREVVAAVSGRGAVAGVAIEACCGAADLADELIEHAGWSVSLAHPGYVARMKQSPDKSDMADARVLAELTRVGWLPRVWLAPAPIRELRRLVGLRQTLIDQRRAARLRLRALLRDLRRRPAGERTRAWSRAWLAWIQTLDLDDASRLVLEECLAQIAFFTQRLTRVEQALEARTREDPVVRRLREMPGVGPVTAWVLRAQVGRFDRFRSGKQLARFCSLCPRNASSGDRVADSGLIRAGDPMLRSTLIELGHRLVRCDQRFGSLASRLRRAGKHPCVIAAAVANRFVRWLHHQMQEPAMT